MKYAMFKAATLVVCVLVSLLALCGCVFSETITERVYDNDPNSMIDYDLDPILINTATAERTSELLPKLAQEESTSQQDTEENLPEPEPPETPQNTPAPTPQYNTSAPSSGEVASSDGEANDNAGQHDAPQGDEEQGEGTPDEPEKQPQDEEKPGDSHQEGENDPSDEGGGEGEGDDPQPGRQSGGSGDFYSDVPSYDDPEIPDNINEVVAFGNNAVIVSMLGGTADGSALLGCDAATHGKTAGMLAARGMGSAAALDYVEGEAMGDAAFQTLVNDIVPDLVFVTEGMNPFDDGQLAVLSENRISVYTLPALISDTRIRFTVQLVGSILDKGGVAGAAQTAQAYIGRCNDIITACVQANGGITGGFDFERGEAASAGAPTTIATLFIDKWDAAARFADPYGYLDSSQGVAMATVGYGSSPVNYYLSIGGALNNAASDRIRALNPAVRSTGIVWQFPRGLMSFSNSSFSPRATATFDLSEHVATGGLFGANLLCYSTGASYGLGGATFPAVIAKNQAIAALLESNSDRPGQLYYPYPTINPAGRGSTVGYFANEATNTYIESCIGLDAGDASVLNTGGSVTPFKVYTNPKSLCQGDAGDTLCAWADGSVESVLEASWAYYRFRGGSQSAFWDDVRGFYADFYGYDLSDAELEEIELGTAN